MKIKIYVLADPISLKVKYIGRTSTGLEQRLGTHLSKAKNNYAKTHKDNWLRSLLRQNLKPYIRLLCEVEGWKESHIVERSLINRYCKRVLNHDDRGEGSKNHTVSKEARILISKALKKQYAENNMPNPARKEIHVYDLEGNYLSSYISGQTAATALKVPYSSIYKCTSGVVKRSHNYQFNLIKVEKMNKVITSRKGICNQQIARERRERAEQS